MGTSWKRCWGLATVALAIGTGVAFGEIHLKSRTGQSRWANRSTGGKSRVPGRVHLMLDFTEPPTAETSALLARRGLQLVSYLPDTGVIVATTGRLDLSGLPLAGYDVLNPSDKLSEELSRAAPDTGLRQFYVVDFHHDVGWEERRQLLRESGIRLHDHPDLAGDQMLVSGMREQMERLAEWDEVYYIFPASGELATGLPLIGCLGAAAPAGMVGQATQRVGEGWDGPGLKEADLTYTLQSLTQRAPSESVRAEILRAMQKWSSVVRVRFSLGANTAAPRNINIQFGTRSHGDQYPFDGPGGVLAHTFYPSPPNPEPIAGDLHFDDDENWQIGRDVDVYSVALHELGHALGLGHSDVPGAVMYPYYRMATDLTAEDIGAIQLLYAAGSGAPPTEPAPTLAITVAAPSPQAVTTASSIAASGNVTGASAVPQVRWSVQGSAGDAAVVATGTAGGYRWSAAIPLSVGPATITVTATESGRTATASVAVERRTQTTPTPSALALSIATPAADTVFTANPASASGTVTGATGATTVRWASDRGFSGSAGLTAAGPGTFQWAVNALSLQPGLNVITFAVSDASGATASRTLRLTLSNVQTTVDSAPPIVRITSPNTSFLMTAAQSIGLSGTASDATSVAGVRWECSCGLTGTAQGTTRWAIPSLPLPRGISVITIKAMDPSGNIGQTAMGILRF